jgi:tripartite-type tricarboxylate transporter receptor subunit TctC
VHLQGNKVKVLGITGSRRTGALPDVRTFREQGYEGGFELDSWFGFMLPAKTPQPVVQQLWAKLRECVDSPDVRTRLAEMGLEPVSSTPEEFAASQVRDLARWASLSRASGVSTT